MRPARQFLYPLLLAPLVLPIPAQAQENFDACSVFTQEDAEKALGSAATGEGAYAKAKRPRFVPQCSYSGVKDGKAVTAAAQFKLARNPAEAQRDFEDARLKLQTKPLLLPGAEAFWAGTTGQMHVRKGRASMTLSVGPTKLSERDVEPARKLAEALVKKL